MLLDRQYEKAHQATLEEEKEFVDEFSKNFEKAYLKYSAIEVAKKVVIGAALIGIGVFTAKKVL